MNFANAIYSAGSKLFNYSTAGNENYTANSITKNITIDKSTTALSIDASPSWDTDNNTEVTITGSNCPSQLTCSLYQDGTGKSNPLVYTFLAGSYLFVYNTTGNATYRPISTNSTVKVVADYNLGVCNASINYTALIIKFKDETFNTLMNAKLSEFFLTYNLAGLNVTKTFSF
jgi:hypothetical protein